MPSDNLTKKEAILRSSQVKNVEYEIYLDITSSILQSTENETFKSVSKINFDYFAQDSDNPAVFVDLKARSINQILLNGELLDSSIYQDYRVVLDNSKLVGKNELIIDANCEYTNTGEGLHRYEAEEENEVYLYTQFEVADSRRMFAVFEQPDIKAQFTFTVKAPTHWILTSTELETKIEMIDSAKLWHFGKTPIMSSYLTSLIAGPFEIWQTTHNNPDGRVIPMRILSRKSLAQYVDYDVVFDITKRGFDYYAGLLGIPYMYNKYDQIFMPQFNAGAMENIGNVTYREDYVFNVKVTNAMKERRIITILHELAHMWFGDYVTMKWWEDLWLNESFAEFVSVQATAEAIGRKNIWVQFNIHEKLWGLEQDEKPTTHPIAADIKDLNDVLVNFDGITYAKGAAVLQALMNYCGRDNFFLGVSNYLKANAYSNATLNDLLTHLENTSGLDIKNWSKKWIESAGPNTFYADFALADNRFTKFNIMQTSKDEHPTLRPNTIKIGFYNFSDGADESANSDQFNVTATGSLSLRGAKLQLVEQFTVNVQDTITTEVQDVIGRLRPDVILLNDEGKAYGKFRLDQMSSEIVLRYPHKFADSLARSIAMTSIWFSVRDGLVKPAKAIEMLFKLLPSESESIMMQTLLNRLDIMVFEMIGADERDQIIRSVGTNLWNLAKDAVPSSDAQYQFLISFTKYASTGDHISVLEAILKGEMQLKGLEIDNHIKWEIRGALARLGALDKTAILLARQNDLTEHGRLGVQFALGSINNESAKKSVFDMVYSPHTKLSNAEIIAAARGFNNVHKSELIKPFANDYFENILSVWNERTFEIAENILETFYPAKIASYELVELAEKWLENNQLASDALIRIVVENLDRTKTALKAQRS